MEIDAKISENNLMYVRNDIIKVVGTEPKIIVNCKTALMCNSNTNIDDILESLDIIRKDLELRKRTQSE
jgi:hypothetical protein